MINTSTDTNFLWMHLFISGLYLIIGLHLIFNPPKDINTSTGLNFPSNMAKLNMDTWTELHAYLGKMLVICGIVCFVLSLLLNYLIGLSELSSSKIEGLNIVLLVIISKSTFLIIFVSAENHLTKTFDKEGNRK